MIRQKDLDARIAGAVGSDRDRASLDQSISLAMRLRREQYLQRRTMPQAGSETATLQARIAAARSSPVT